MKNAKKRIRFSINTLGGGGAEKVLVDLLNKLDPERYDVSLVVVSGGIHAGAVPEYVQMRKIVKTEHTLLKKLFERIVYHMPNWLFSRLFLNGKYDIEVAYLEGSPTKRLSGLKTDAKKIAFVHFDNSVKNLLEPYYQSKQNCFAQYRAFDRVCFVSKQAKKGFEETIGVLPNAEVVHNVLDIGNVLQKAEAFCEEKYKTTGLKIVSVGRLSDPKNYPRLLKAVHQLERQYPMEVWIIGEGDEREKLESMIRELKIKSVRLLGFRNNPYALVKQADLYVCSSDFEGYSTAVTEAIYLGLPVLTTECAGMDEILEDGKYGMIVENSDEGFLRGLKSIVDEKDILNVYKKRISERSHVLNSIDPVAEYEALFMEVCDETGN